jgi:uncharacterized protein
MDTFRLGRTNMMVTRLGFGGIPIQRLSEADAVAVVKRCLDLGINFIDTANGYSTSEERIGKAIKGRRESVFLATKSGSKNPEEFQKHLQLSLTRLGVDYIDLYQFHGVSDFKNLDKVMEPGGVLAVAEEAKKKGLIKHIGITCHQIDVAKKAVQTDLFETVMFPFNFITSEAADVLLPLCRKHNVGFICMKPLAGGMIDNAAICFKYLFQFPEVVSIPGIEKVSEIEEIADILETAPRMTPEDKKEMKRIKEALGSRFCHRCDYCQPCSTGIPISMIMTAKSFYKRLPPERFYSPMVIPGMEKAAKCTQCGECETRCPYHLPIREMIAEQVAWFQDLMKIRQQQEASKPA